MGSVTAFLLAAALQTEPDAVRAAVARAIPLVEKSSAVFMDERLCFSCHHQGVPVLALTTARKAGFKVDGKNLAANLKYSWEFLKRGRDRYESGRGQGGRADTAGWALWTLQTGGWKPDETTTAVVEFLLKWNADLGYWRANAQRNPAEGSSFNTTLVSLRGLDAYATEAQKPRAKKRLEAARKWLAATSAKDHEDRVYRLWAMRYADVDDAEIGKARRELVDRRNPDGAWRQKDSMEPDAYATAVALVALREAGGMKTEDPVYRRGVDWLVARQHDDGSWHVATHSRPVQKYFESAFPHGKDQFISIYATAWAIDALAAQFLD